MVKITGKISSKYVKMKSSHPSVGLLCNAFFFRNEQWDCELLVFEIFPLSECAVLALGTQSRVEPSILVFTKVDVAKLDVLLIQRRIFALINVELTEEPFDERI